MSRLDGGIEISPSRVTRDTVHVEFTVFAANHLVSEGWQLLVVVTSIQGEGKFVLIGRGRCSSPELALVKQEVACIKGHVFFIREEDASSIDDH